MCVTNMWNILFLGLLISTTSIFCDVSHLLHNGYPTHRPNNPLELPGQGSSATSVTDYPNVSAENRFQIPGASTGVSPNQIPDTQEKGSSSGAQISHDHSHDHGSGHHHHGEDGRYNPHDDGTGWDIRKSVPGEPGRDYPVYDEVPSTSFTCKQKVPGYYADEEAGCQAFRICTTDSYKTAYNFLCPNGTLFNQRVLTCDWWMNVDCTASSEFYYRNQEIGKMPTGQQLMKEVTKMLEAPNKKPYIFTQQQTDAIANMIKENSDERFSQDFYVPPKVVTSTTQVYIPPPVSSTTLVYIPPPVSSTTQVYIPPVTTTTTTTTTPLPPKISQTSLGTVQTPQVQVGDKKLHVSQVLKTSPVLHVSPPKLFVSKPQVLSANNNNKNKISPAQKQHGGDLFVSPILSTRLSKTEGQLFTSMLSKTSNAQPLLITQIPFVSQEATVKTSGGSQLTIHPNSASFGSTTKKPFVSQEATVKTSGGRQLTFHKNNAPFVSQEASLKTSGSSQLTNAPFVSTTKLFDDKQMSTTKSFVSQEVVAKPSSASQLLIPSSNASPTMKPSGDGQLFVSQMKPLNAQPLLASRVAMKQDKLLTSVERPVTNNATNHTKDDMQQLFLSQTGQATGSVGYEQKKIDQTSNEAASGGYSYPQPKQTISSSTGFVSNQQNNQPIPSVTVTKEKTHTVTHSEKVTHVFKDVQDGPVKIPLLDNQNVVSTNVPTGIQQNAISQSQQPGFIQTGTSGFQQQEFIQTGIPQVQQPNLQPKLQAPTGFPKITKEEAFQQIDQIQTAIPQVQQPIFQSNLQTSTGFTQPKITKEEAFQQINQIQTGLNQIKEQQTQLNNLGHGILNPRVNAPGIPVQNFGATRFTNTEIPQGFTHQGVQPILFDSQNFPAQGYQQSSFHQNSFQSSVPNLQQSSFHQNNFQSSVPNLNTQFFQGGLANNFKGLSEQSTFRGQNNQFREVTKVDIVPSLGFHLNDEFERNTYISAVSKGLIRDGYQVSGSQSYGQNIFSPSDARFSSYQGPSSYLVPQSSVEGLPSNSGYRYR